MPDRTTVIGLFVIAGLAWVLPGTLRLVARALGPPKSVVYAEEPGRTGERLRLLWSPSESLESPARFRGQVVTPDGTPLRPIAGWEGLLLGNPLDLNLATSDDLEALPRVGPKTAVAILAARDRLGGFQRVNDLLVVSGVGPKTLARLRPLVQVAP